MTSQSDEIFKGTVVEESDTGVLIQTEEGIKGWLYFTMIPNNIKRDRTLIGNVFDVKKCVATFNSQPLFTAITQ
ncbi:hypothetical protein JW758_03785 [Candidatus Peregrinibacteria bacterium]|nr:hypothetical protein [Candidatus Peregrinibacteria bacterium]